MHCAQCAEGPLHPHHPPLHQQPRALHRPRHRDVERGEDCLVRPHKKGGQRGQITC